MAAEGSGSSLCSARKRIAPGFSLEIFKPHTRRLVPRN
jgi:hypothetical protein